MRLVGDLFHSQTLPFKLLNHADVFSDGLRKYAFQIQS